MIRANKEFKTSVWYIPEKRAQTPGNFAIFRQSTGNWEPVKGTSNYKNGKRCKEWYGKTGSKWKTMPRTDTCL